MMALPVIFSPFFRYYSPSSSSVDVAPLQQQILQNADDISNIYDVLAEQGFMTYNGMSIAGNNEVGDMLDNIFDGDGTSGEEISEIPDELKDKITSPEDFSNMLDDVFGVNP